MPIRFSDPLAEPVETRAAAGPADHNTPRCGKGLFGQPIKNLITAAGDDKFGPLDPEFLTCSIQGRVEPEAVISKFQRTPDEWAA